MSNEQMVSADALKKQIAKVKRCFRSENSDYMTGYLSALSVVEGLIAYLTEPSKPDEDNEMEDQKHEQLSSYQGNEPSGNDGFPIHLSSPLDKGL